MRPSFIPWVGWRLSWFSGGHLALRWADFLAARPQRSESASITIQTLSPFLTPGRQTWCSRVGSAGGSAWAGGQVFPQRTFTLAGRLVRKSRQAWLAAVLSTGGRTCRASWRGLPWGG